MHLLGYQRDLVMRSLYRRACLLVFLSLFAGFGLPLAEAMAVGCPIVCARRASLPEVADGAALYCNAQDPESIVNALVTLWKNEPMRRTLVDDSRGSESN